MIIDTDELRDEILDEIREEVKDIVCAQMQDYITEDDDCWMAIQERVGALVRECLSQKILSDVWDEFHRLQKQVLQHRPEKHFEDKLEALARNMDALYLEIQSLKNQS